MPLSAGSANHDASLPHGVQEHRDGYFVHQRTVHSTTIPGQRLTTSSGASSKRVSSYWRWRGNMALHRSQKKPNVQLFNSREEALAKCVYDMQNDSAVHA